MDFTTLSYLLFLAAIGFLYFLTPARARPALLLISSCGFYWLWSRWMLLLILAATGLAYGAARALESPSANRTRRAIMAGVATILIAVLVFFKSLPYSHEFLRKNLLVDIVMPLGLSYYIFKLVGYVVDVYWGKTLPEKNFISFAAYVSFFPQIVAGPIQRAESFLPQIHQFQPVAWQMRLLGVQRILLGYFKKFVVADNLALLVNFVYSHIHDAGTPLLLGYYAYPLQMYADFSGLTDIAIGSAMLLGITSPENFNAPFSAATPSEYWRGWHMTLTTWLTDYVFMPLRMSTRRLGDAGLVISLFINMILIGIWHGFRWSFALFGVVHAIYLSVDALTARARKRYYKVHPGADRLTNWIGPVVTFHLVAIAFVFFRGDSIPDIFYMLTHLAGSISHTSQAFRDLVSVFGRSIATGFAGYGLSEIADYIRRHYSDTSVPFSRWGRWSLTSGTAAAVLVVVLMLLAGGGDHNPFLYAIF